MQAGLHNTGLVVASKACLVCLSTAGTFDSKAKLMTPSIETSFACAGKSRHRPDCGEVIGRLMSLADQDFRLTQCNFEISINLTVSGSHQHLHACSQPTPKVIDTEHDESRS